MKADTVRGIHNSIAPRFASPRRISFIVLVLAFFHVYSVPIQEKVRILNSCPNEKSFSHMFAFAKTTLFPTGSQSYWLN